MTDVLIKRELLEDAALWLEAHSSGSGSAESFTAQDIREALSAPRQPEGEGLDVVASQFPEINFANYGQDEVEALQAWGFTALDAMADAQRAIAELREEISDLHTTMMAAAVEIQEHWQAHCDEEGCGPVKAAMTGAASGTVRSRAQSSSASASHFRQIMAPPLAQDLASPSPAYRPALPPRSGSGAGRCLPRPAGHSRRTSTDRARPHQPDPQPETSGWC